VDDDLLDRLERRGLISTRVSNARSSVALAHPLYGQVLRDELPAGRSRRLTRQLAELVEESGSRSRDDLLRIGCWRLQCGGGQPDVLLGASSAAFDRFDYVLADRLATAALGAGAGLDAHVLLAEITAMQGDRAGAEEQLGRLWREATDDAQRLKVALPRIDNAMLRSRPATVIRLSDEALIDVADDAGRLALGARRLWGVLYTAGPRAGLEESETLTANREGAQLIAVSVARALALPHLGRTGEALEAAAQGEKAHRAAKGEFHWPVTLHDFFRCEALAAAGRFLEMERTALAAYDAATEEGSLRGQAWAAYQAASALSARGRASSAVRYAREACALFQGDPFALSQALLNLAYTCAIAGDPAASADAIARFDALDTSSELGWHWGGLLHARGWTAAASGDLPSAHRLLDEEATRSEGCGDLARAGMALHSRVRLGDPKPVAARLRSLAARVEGDLAQIRAEHAATLARPDPAGLAEVSVSFEAIGADLLAAEVSADEAVVWRRRGESRKATTAEHRAAELLDRCEGAAPTPATLSVGTRALLTPAELGTALLAADGRSNKEIAEELCVSIRTVESRLQHVYSKLGISRRRDLSAHLLKD
jgi:DNA-binding CsgD family transcriptional regulator